MWISIKTLAAITVLSFFFTASAQEASQSELKDRYDNMAGPALYYPPSPSKEPKDPSFTSEKVQAGEYCRRISTAVGGGPKAPVADYYACGEE